MDSSGLSTLLAAREAGGEDFEMVLVVGPGMVRRLLDTTAIGTLFTVVDTLDGALSDLRSDGAVVVRQHLVETLLDVGLGFAGALLDRAHQLVLTLGAIEIVVGQRAPGFLDLSLDLIPFAL